MIRAEQNTRRQRQSAAGLRHEVGQLRHHEGDENDDQRRAGEGEEGRINERLLHPVAQIFLLHQVLDHARQNIGQRAARFAGADHVHIKRREDARKIAQGLRETASVNQRLMQRARHLLNARMFQPLLEHAEALVEGHAGLQEVAELLGENQQLAVRNLKVLCRSRAAAARPYRRATTAPPPSLRSESGCNSAARSAGWRRSDQRH